MQHIRSPYTRKLPHFDVGQAYYHLVFRLREGHLSEEEIRITRDHINEGNDQFYRLIAVQVMSNHVHVILQPSANIKLTEVVRRIKGGSARKINLIRGTSGALWSDKYFDRVIRNQDDLEKTLKYLELNPVKLDAEKDGWNCAGWSFVQE